MPQNQKRTKQLIIRVSESEHEALKKRNTKTHLASWMRETCLQEKQLQIRKPVDAKLLVSLSRMNGNLNQIAKYINYQKLDNNSIDFFRVLTEISLIRTDINQLLSIYAKDAD